MAAMDWTAEAGGAGTADRGATVALTPSLPGLARPPMSSLLPQSSLLLRREDVGDRVKPGHDDKTRKHEAAAPNLMRRPAVVWQSLLPASTRSMSFSVLTSHVVVRQTRVTKCDLGLAAARLHCNGHDGSNSLGALGHPRVFDKSRPIDFEKSPVMRPGSCLRVLWRCRAARPQPGSESRAPRRTMVPPRNCDIGELHRDVSFCLFIMSTIRRLTRAAH
jgi:hypothetical protein